MIGTGTSFRLRQAEANDARALIELQGEIYDEGRWFVGEGPPGEMALARRLRALDPTMSLYLVAESEGDLCGWLELHRLQPPRLSHVAILTLAVARRWRRHGIGRSLLGQGYEWAQSTGVRKISLNVRAGNQAAIRLYRQEGFEVEGREREQVRTDDGFEDNLIMARFTVPTAPARVDGRAAGEA